MNFNIDHDRFVQKNKSIAKAYERDRKDSSMEKKGFSHIQRQQEASCFNCKLKNRCSEFRLKTSGGSHGAVSLGGDEEFICKKYVPVPSENRGMNDKQVKSLLKSMKRNLR